MEVSSREVCYGYSRNFFLFCWVQTMFLFMDKRFEKAGKEVVWSCLWQCFHQGTGLQQYACACAYNVLSSGHSLVAMMLSCTCTICNMLVAMSFIRARACVSVLVLVIVIGWCACGNVLSTGHWLAKGKVALKLCTNRRLLTANRFTLYIHTGSL